MTITKKIILIIGVILFAIPTYAVDMCASENAIVFVLDPSINKSGDGSSDAPTSTWRVPFSYGTITGISACLSYTSSQSNQANNGTVFGGEQNGEYCWCKMTHPAISKWISYSYSTMSYCNTNCSASCAYFVGSSTENRKKFFQTIAN